MGIIDQNRDGIISKDDLRDVLATMGQLNVNNDELDAMIKEASGPINFTVFLTMFGEKLKGADPEDVIVSAFKVLDPEGTGSIKKEFLEELLTTQCDRFTPEEMTNLWAAFPPDVAGNVDYKNICYVITHGEEKESKSQFYQDVYSTSVQTLTPPYLVLLHLRVVLIHAHSLARCLPSPAPQRKTCIPLSIQSKRTEDCGSVCV